MGSACSTNPPTLTSYKSILSVADEVHRLPAFVEVNPRDSYYCNKQIEREIKSKYKKSTRSPQECKVLGSKIDMLKIEMINIPDEAAIFEQISKEIELEDQSPITNINSEIASHEVISSQQNCFEEAGRNRVHSVDNIRSILKSKLNQSHQANHHVHFKQGEKIDASHSNWNSSVKKQGSTSLFQTLDFSSKKKGSALQQSKEQKASKSKEKIKKTQTKSFRQKHK